MLKGQAAPSLLDTYTAERAPIGKQIVDRANKSIGEFGPIFEALGLLDSTDPAVMKANMDRARRTSRGRRGAREQTARGHCLQGLRVRRAWRRNEPALRVGGRGAGRNDGAGLRDDPELVYQATTFPGARAAACLGARRTASKLSTLDLCGKGRFTLITSIGGDAWIAAADASRPATGVPIRTVKIGPGCDVRGSLWRLGARPRGRRHGLPSGAAGPSRRLAREEAAPPMRPAISRRVFARLLGKPAIAPKPVARKAAAKKPAAKKSTKQPPEETETWPRTRSTSRKSSRKRP